MKNDYIHGIDTEFFQIQLEKFIHFIPKLLLACLFIGICILLLKFILFIIRKSLRYIKLDRLMAKLNDENNSSSIFNSKIINPEKIILGFVKWFLILIFIIIGADILNLDVVSNEIGKIVQYLPKAFLAAVIFFIGTYGAVFLKKTVQKTLKAFDLNGSKVISLLVFYVIFILVVVMTLNQVGIDTKIITNYLTLILGAFLATFMIALGIGSRDIVKWLLLGFYSKKNFKLGLRVRIDDLEGVITGIDNIVMVVTKDDETKVVLPIKEVSEKKVEILS